MTAIAHRGDVADARLELTLQSVLRRVRKAKYLLGASEGQREKRRQKERA